jgi:hypothetical protein
MNSKCPNLHSLLAVALKLSEADRSVLLRQAQQMLSGQQEKPPHPERQAA